MYTNEFHYIPVSQTISVAVDSFLHLRIRGWAPPPLSAQNHVLHILWSVLSKCTRFRCIRWNPKILHHSYKVHYDDGFTTNNCWIGKYPRAPRTSLANFCKMFCAAGIHFYVHFPSHWCCCVWMSTWQIPMCVPPAEMPTEIGEMLASFVGCTIITWPLVTWLRSERARYQTD